MSKDSARPTPEELEDAFIKVTLQEDDAPSGDRLHGQWIDQASAQRSDPLLFGTNALRKLYPGYSVVVGGSSILGFPDALMQPIAPEHMVSTAWFLPPTRRSGVSGVLVDLVSYGAFHVAWDNYDFIVYVAKYMLGNGTYTTQFVLHEGSEEPSRNLLLAVGAWQVALHNEIWVFDQGYWQKDDRLYTGVQKANWSDVILDETFKSALQKDVYGFFTSERIYQELAIPWKRGLIFYGPPGNGKTISIKAIMKACIDKGHVPLYVKSFTSFMGDEASIALVFDKARSQAPCVLVLEDLDSLITDRNRSFFLNQLDGLESNDGLLVIGSTNHFEKLDPALSTRPSRFDRKYLFNNPTRDERILYVQYWQDKLKHNKDVSFPDDLKDEIADTTNGFSFAYLKEAFISSLVFMASYEDEKKPGFETIIKEQIAHLRSQLNHKSTSPAFRISIPSFTPSKPEQHKLVVHGSEVSSGSNIYRAEPSAAESKDVNSLAKAAAALGRSFVY